MIFADAPDGVKNQAQNTIIRFATKILRPVVRILLRYGLSCNELQEVCSWLYVDEATKRRELTGGRASERYVAIVTGLSEEAVVRYKSHSTPETLLAETPANCAAWVQDSWLKNPRYLDAGGAPLAIPFAASAGPSFTDLVRDYSSEMTPRAMLSELESAGAVEVRGDRIRLIQTSYLPAAGDELLEIAGMSAADLLTTIEHNLGAKARDRYFQRELYYPLIPAERVGECKRVLSDHLKPVMEQLYNDILRYGDSEPQPGKKYKRVGIGAYYFQ